MAFVAPAAGRAAAGRASGRRASTRRASTRRNLAEPASAGDVNEELQRRRRVAAGEEDELPDEHEDQDDEDQDDEDQDDEDQDDEDRGRRRLDRMEPASSGAGLVLGVIVWAVVLNYMEGGVPQVKRLFAAKFLNKTGGA